MSTVDVKNQSLLRKLLHTAEGHANPYPLYRELLAASPMHFRTEDGTWYAFGYPECRGLLADPSCSVRPQDSSDGRPIEGGGRLSASMVMHDPPEHTRLRRLVGWAFTPSAVQRLRPRITALVDAALDEVSKKGEADFMSDVAYPLPAAVIGEVVGIPPAEAARFIALSDVGSVAAEGESGTEALKRARRADEELERAFLEVIEHRKRSPKDDLVGSMVEADNGQSVPTLDEVVSTVMLLFIAGVLTTTHFIGNGLLALLRHPAQLERLKREVALMPLAVEEMLRYDGPVQVVARTLTGRVDVTERVLDEGARVVAVLGSANRDPRRFADPDRFDVGRTNSSSLAFGWGVHHCLGIHLARLEGEILFTRLLERFRKLELVDEDPPIVPGLMIRGPGRLLVRTTPH
ncbi:MAG: cytochrome P450 [Actinomycetota bacterium]|nr:cytochrome P450 [Actinomycetota bacterium]